MINYQTFQLAMFVMVMTLVWACFMQYYCFRLQDERKELRAENQKLKGELSELHLRDTYLSSDLAKTSAIHTP